TGEPLPVIQHRAINLQLPRQRTHISAISHPLHRHTAERFRIPPDSFIAHSQSLSGWSVVIFFCSILGGHSTQRTFAQSLQNLPKGTRNCLTPRLWLCRK